MNQKKTMTITKALESLSMLVNLSPDEERLLQDPSSKKALIEQFTKPQEIYNQTGHKSIVLLKNSFNKAINKVHKLYLNHQSSVDKHFDKDKLLYKVKGAVERVSLCQRLMQKAFKGVDRLRQMAAHYHFKKKVFRAKQPTVAKKVEAFTQHLWGGCEKWPRRSQIKNLSLQDAYLSLEDIKEDESYELLYLKKASGGRFFKNHLKTQLATAKDYSLDSEALQLSKDPFIKIKQLKDKKLCYLSQEMLNSLTPYLSEFYRQFAQYRSHSIVKDTHAFIMALKLAANERLLLERQSNKCCHDYFVDFLVYLRKVLTSKDYQNYLKHPPNKEGFFSYLLSFVHQLCLQVYTHKNKGMDNWEALMHLMSLEGKSSSHNSIEALEKEYQALQKLLQAFPNGPLFKMLDYLQSDFYLHLDPIFHLNLPQHLYTLRWGKQATHLLKLPSPTSQHYVHESHLLPEFLGFLRAYADPNFNKKHLLINLQSRKSWVEKARSYSLEKLNEADLSSFESLTYGLSSDFFHQNPPYHSLHEAESFKKLCVEKLLEQEGQYHFLGPIKQLLSKKKLKALVEFIHLRIFKGKLQLDIQQRLMFHDLLFHLTTWYVLAKQKPHSFSFTCKDGLDQGGSCALLFQLAIQTLFNECKDSLKIQPLFYQWVSECLLVRERLPRERDFTRLIKLMKGYEKIKPLSKSSKEELYKVLEIKGEDFFFE